MSVLADLAYLFSEIFRGGPGPVGFTPEEEGEAAGPVFTLPFRTISAQVFDPGLSKLLILLVSV